MILSEVVGAPVVAGRQVGYLNDLRFVVDGAPQTLLSEARLFGLIVCPRKTGSFLGYERSGVTAPWPLANLFRWHNRGSFLVLWDDVVHFGADEVRLREGFRHYSPALG